MKFSDIQIGQVELSEILGYHQRQLPGVDYSWHQRAAEELRGGRLGDDLLQVREDGRDDTSEE